MRMLHIAGLSGMGKTLLLEEMLAWLPHPLVIKWSHHALFADAPGSDTERLGRLASSTILVGQDGLLWRHRSMTDRPQLYQLLASVLSDDRLVVVEGDKLAQHPKIWIGTATSAPSSPIALIIGPDRLDSQVPWYPTDLPLSTDTLPPLVEYLKESWSRFCITVDPEKGLSHE